MSSVQYIELSWETITMPGQQAEDVSEYLWDADIGSVLFTKDPLVLKKVLFECMKKYESYAPITIRCLQLLQDCHLLLPNGITNNELTESFSIILHSLLIWISKTDVVMNLFQLLAIVADREVVKDHCCKTDDLEVLSCIEKALTFHNGSKPVQRAGLQLFQEILNHADRSNLNLICSKIFKPVLDNLILNNSDPGICFSSYKILVILADEVPDMIFPWIDQILNITLTVMNGMYSSEIVASCLDFLDKIAFDGSQLIVIASHPRGLFSFCDSISSLSPKYLPEVIIALHFLCYALEDDQLTSQLFNDNNRRKLTKDLSSELDNKFMKFMGLVHRECHDQEDQLSSIDQDQVKYAQILHKEVIDQLDNLALPPESAKYAKAVVTRSSNGLDNALFGQFSKLSMEKLFTPKHSRESMGPFNPTTAVSKGQSVRTNQVKSSLKGLLLDLNSSSFSTDTIFPLASSETPLDHQPSTASPSIIHPPQPATPLNGDTPATNRGIFFPKSQYDEEELKNIIKELAAKLKFKNTEAAMYKKKAAELEVELLRSASLRKTPSASPGRAVLEKMDDVMLHRDWASRPSNELPRYPPPPLPPSDASEASKALEASSGKRPESVVKGDPQSDGSSSANQETVSMEVQQQAAGGTLKEKEDGTDSIQGLKEKLIAVQLKMDEMSQTYRSNLTKIIGENQEDRRQLRGRLLEVSNISAKKSASIEAMKQDIKVLKSDIVKLEQQLTSATSRGTELETQLTEARNDLRTRNREIEKITSGCLDEINAINEKINELSALNSLKSIENNELRVMLQQQDDKHVKIMANVFSKRNEQGEAISKLQQEKLERLGTIQHLETTIHLLKNSNGQSAGTGSPLSYFMGGGGGGSKETPIKETIIETFQGTSSTEDIQTPFQENPLRRQSSLNIDRIIDGSGGGGGGHDSAIT